MHGVSDFETKTCILYYVYVFNLISGWVSSNSSLKGKIFIITGANTGLGYETAKHLVNRGAIVIMACRSEEKCKEAIKKIREFTKEGEMIYLELDLASFESIKKFARQIKEEYPVFDCLINNAGLAVQDKQLTKENFVSLMT